METRTQLLNSKKNKSKKNKKSFINSFTQSFPIMVNSENNQFNHNLIKKKIKLIQIINEYIEDKRFNGVKYNHSNFKGNNIQLNKDQSQYIEKEINKQFIITIHKLLFYNVNKPHQTIYELYRHLIEYLILYNDYISNKYEDIMKQLIKLFELIYDYDELIITKGGYFEKDSNNIIEIKQIFIDIVNYIYINKYNIGDSAKQNIYIKQELLRIIKINKILSNIIIEKYISLIYDKGSSNLNLLENNIDYIIKILNKKYLYIENDYYDLIDYITFIDIIINQIIKSMDVKTKTINTQPYDILLKDVKSFNIIYYDFLLKIITFIHIPQRLNNIQENIEQMINHIDEIVKHPMLSSIRILFKKIHYYLIKILRLFREYTNQSAITDEIYERIEDYLSEGVPFTKAVHNTYNYMISQGISEIILIPLFTPLYATSGISNMLYQPVKYMKNWFITETNESSQHNTQDI